MICSMVVFCLLDGGILRFIKDDEGFLERASAHVGKRRDFDLSLLLQPHEVFRAEHIQQSIEERTKVRIHLFLQIPGKEAQFLTGFDRRTYEDDALDIVISKRKGSECDSEVRLACPSGADAEGDGISPDGIDVDLLSHSPGAQRRALLGEIDDVVFHVFEQLFFAFIQEGHHHPDLPRRETDPLTDHPPKSPDHAHTLIDCLFLALEPDEIAAGKDVCAVVLADDGKVGTVPLQKRAGLLAVVHHDLFYFFCHEDPFICI